MPQPWTHWVVSDSELSRAGSHLAGAGGGPCDKSKSLRQTWSWGGRWWCVWGVMPLALQVGGRRHQWDPCQARGLPGFWRLGFTLESAPSTIPITFQRFVLSG